MKRIRFVCCMIVGLIVFAVAGCNQKDPETEYYKNLAAQIAQNQPPTAEETVARIKIESDKLNATMRTWLGHSKSQLFQVWGVPVSAFDDGQGGQIVTYSASPFGAADPDPSTRTFYVNGQGIIYNTGWHSLWWK